MQQAAVTHILPVTLISRTRVLPTKGKVLVHLDQHVNATDVIAEARQPGQHQLVDVRRGLGISSKKDISALIERRVGDKLQKGDIIAQSKGLFARIVSAPVDAEIVSIFSGKVLLETAGGTIYLKAGISGTVTEVLPEYGATIETNGMLIQGVWGNRGIDQGVLLNLANNPNDELTPARLDVSMRGAVVLGGHCNQAAALQAAAELPLRGLVLGSMTANLLPVASKLNIPILLLEGFGNIPINTAAFKLLSSNEKRDLTVIAQPWNRMTGERPELVINLPTNAAQAPELVDLLPGTTVRITSMPHSGKIGTLEKIPAGMSILPNRLRAQSALIRMEDNELIVVPLANLDVLK
ncbi:MAG TPA: hypothetical protein VFF78_07675 [Anaerolineaceae bacterium]|nr:hypothetical protein [Anaerolineaceae bacterium]